jgi:hypothetical protein
MNKIVKEWALVLGPVCMGVGSSESRNRSATRKTL